MEQDNLQTGININEIQHTYVPYNYEAYYKIYKTNDTPYCEKYRPSDFSTIIDHKYIIQMLRNYINNQDYPNLLIYSQPGMGKTSMIMAAMNELFNDTLKFNTLFINSSEARGVDVIRSLVSDFITNSSMNTSISLKIIILDEADSMTNDSAIMIKSIMETNSNVRFCFICNYEKKIISQIVSRCVILKFNNISKIEILKRCTYICKNEGVIITQRSLKKIINFSEGDVRKILNILQSLSIAFKDTPIFCNDIEYYLHIPNKRNIENMINIFKDNKISFDDKFNMYNEKYKYYDILIIIKKINKVFKNEIKKNINNNELCLLLCNQIKQLSKLELYVYSNIDINILVIYLIHIFN